MRRKVERTEVRIETKGADTVRVVSDYDHTLHLFSFFDTATLPFVRYTIRMPATARLEIEDHKSETTVAIRSRLYVNTAEAAVDAAVAGLGLTRVLSYQSANAVRASALALALEDFELTPWPVSLVYPAQRLLPLKLRAFIDFAAPRLKAALSPGAM